MRTQMARGNIAGEFRATKKRQRTWSERGSMRCVRRTETAIIIVRRGDCFGYFLTTHGLETVWSRADL